MLNFPCKQCITYPICITTFNKIRASTYGGGLHYVINLMEKCSIFKEIIMDSFSVFDRNKTNYNNAVESLKIEITKTGL